MSVHQPVAARTSQAAHTSSRVSVLPAFPESAFLRSSSHDDGPPLPDHFPEPVTAEPQPDRNKAHPHSGLASSQCPAQRGEVKNHQHDIHNGVHDPDEAKAGVRRITDKYAAPSVLRANGSEGSGDTYPSSASPLETWPASTTTTYSLSPTSSGVSSSPVMNGSLSGEHHVSPVSSGPSVHNAASRHNGHSQRLAPLSLSSSAFSDASSDNMSDASPSPAFTGSVRSESTNGGRSGLLVGRGRYQSVSGIALSTSLGDGVTEEDVQQVEMFYRSHRTEVTVCHSLANLYFGTCGTSIPGSADGRLSPSSGGGDLWEFVTTGIPLLVLDSGDHLRSRQLSVVMAEKGTGFVLWKDVVSHLTDYSCLTANFHTLRISSDNSKLAGLSFDHSKAAADFAAAMQTLTSDPDDELLMLSKKGKKKKKKKQDSKKKAKFKPPKKTDISQPCCFQHVTKLERPQVTGLTPLPPNGFPPAPGGSLSSLTDDLHDRLSVSASRARSPSSELSDVSAEH